ncbi:HAMP domain-containing sensor histidine kinase [Bdellovibrio sp. NC01]|uniref:sensor histidine kinase n=1 Tax=Bdellovibrio sp. NC01 TaxID=2220073 RepID=UPI00115AA8A4|nr:HAMP domain-containing sensor histidine kinase [Bdellovibrio sp. NC01]QDK39153.1 sensor histidine kinase [Bdellovibrio sp. NC01]
MMKKLLKPNVKTLLAIIWFAFTFSLVTWWWIFFLLRFQSSASHRMFAWEGSILIAAILIGGIALIVFSYRDQKRHQRLRFFFSTFSHDIKTSIARLRLQAEVLEEDLNGNNSPVMKRLIQDIQRLDLQLENSLLLANLEEGHMLREDVSLNTLFGSLKNEFPDLSLEIEKEASIKGDRRALMSVFRNLLQNAVLHGKADTIRIKVRALNSHRLEIVVSDNGLGFKGHLNKLGSEILISTDSRGNGIGLLITKRLLEKMNGDVKFESKENAGFSSIIQVEGRL